MVVANILNMPGPVIHLIYGHLTNAKDRSTLALTCKHLYQKYLESLNVAYVKVEDHRPFVQHVKMQEETDYILQRSTKYKDRGNCLGVIGAGSCVSGVAITGSCGGCCCCKVSTVCAKILCYTGLSCFGAGFVFLTAGTVVCCCSKSRDQEVKLVRKFNEEEALLKDFSQKLHIQRPPRALMEEPPEPSYQGGGDYYGPA